MLVTAAPASTARTWVTSFGATLFAMLALQVSNLGFSPLVPAIQHEFGLSFSQVGLFAGMYGLISVFISVPAGLMIRKAGERLYPLGPYKIKGLSPARNARLMPEAEPRRGRNK